MTTWGMRQAREPVLVQALIAEPAIERLDVAVLRRLAGLDQPQRDAARVRPGRTSPEGAQCSRGHDGEGVRGGVVNDSSTLESVSRPANPSTESDQLQVDGDRHRLA